MKPPVEEFHVTWARAFRLASEGQTAEVVEFAALLPVTLPAIAARILAELRAEAAARGVVSRRFLNTLGKFPDLSSSQPDGVIPYRRGLVAATLAVGGVLLPYGEDGFSVGPGLDPRCC